MSDFNLFIVFGIFLIVIGIVLISKKKQSEKLIQEQQKAYADKKEEKKDTKEPEAKKKEAKVVVRKVPLEQLVVPAGFPREVLFFYGSQTGTAEKFCQTLDQELHTFLPSGRSAHVVDCEEFKGPETFPEGALLVMCVATHYEGDPCDNMKKLYKWLREARKQKDPTLLKGRDFIVFGLGDTSYEQYNAIGKMVNDGFAELGGERVFKYGEGNAEGNHTEDDFNEWKADMWEELCKYYESRPATVLAPPETAPTDVPKEVSAEETKSAPLSMVDALKAALASKLSLVAVEITSDD